MKIILVLWLSLLSHSVYAIQFSSTGEQATLIELFTSQGCSSCPPADNWLGKLKDNPDLWSKYIPIAWHVDYWDYIGWKDQFAQESFAVRQRLYRSNGNVNSVYTPGLLKNGKEWRSWFWRKSLKNSGTQVGKLMVSYKDNNAYIEYKPVGSTNNQKLDFNIALLESGLSHKINAGENHGKTLEHDFVVRQHTSVASNKNTVNIPFAFTKGKNQALAVWLNDANSKKVVQATGAWLNE